MLSQTAESPLSKRKRVNRTAKMKQNKLDARREQWLSQGRQQGTASPSMSPKSCGNGDYEFVLHGGGGDSDTESCVINQDDLCDGQLLKGSCISVSCSNSISQNQGQRDFLHGSSPVQVPVVLNPDFDAVAVKQQQQQHQKKQEQSKRKSGRVKCKLDCFGSSEQQQGLLGNGSNQGQVEDDWEAAADALSCQINLNTEPENGSAAAFKHPLLEPPKASAWKRDDTFRPASLPKPGVYFGDGLLPLPSTPPVAAVLPSCWGRVKQLEQLKKPPKVTVVTCCPICTEELDSTDSSFLPCPCGFRLCLFCHHRIAAEDGRCPGCRKCYSSSSSGKSAGKATAALAV